MSPIETRNAVWRLIEKHRFKQAIERLKKWGSANGNDWIVSEANRLLDELAELHDSEHGELAERIAALANCVVTGGYPEMGGGEGADSGGSASGFEFDMRSEHSSEISHISDNIAAISEGFAPISLPPLVPSMSRKKAQPPRNNANAGDTPTDALEKMPTMSSKSKPVFGTTSPLPISANTVVPPPPMPMPIPLPPQMGGLLYNIPSKMKQNEDITCIVRIAFNKTQLKTADDKFTEEVVKEIRVSRVMEVEMENEGTEEVFKIVAKSDKQQSLDTFEATEWRFAVRPLLSGTHSLLLKVTIVETDAAGKETRKEKILEEEISISTQKAKKIDKKSSTKDSASTNPTSDIPNPTSEGFMSADLKLKDLKTLLFMGANPPGTRVLQLEVEHSRIATKINNRFRIEVEKFLSASEIPELIIDKKPSIIHFSGHGKDPDSNEQGETADRARAIGKIADTASKGGGIVVFDDDMRSLKVIETAVLDFMFKHITTNLHIVVDVVVFNSCYSEAQAKVIGKYVPYVVGSARAIGDDVAIAFASGFYFGMSKGLPVENAFTSGKIQAVVADIKAQDLIVLYKNGVKMDL